jgi:DNA-binding response OmpR family regulator
MSRQSVLVVEDDAQVRALCAQALTEEGFSVRVARNGVEALQRVEEQLPQIMIIDVVMPEMNGVELCRAMRRLPSAAGLPVLFLTARGDIADKATGFAVGADDYLTKPFDIRELVMRVRALLRRPAGASGTVVAAVIDAGDLSLDPGQFTVTTPETTALLTPAEFDLLAYLMQNAGRIHSSQKLLEEVWGYKPLDGSADLVRRHIKNIRDKIEPTPSKPRYIRTVRPHGYVVEA